LLLSFVHSIPSRPRGKFSTVSLNAICHPPFLFSEGILRGRIISGLLFSDLFLDCARLFLSAMMEAAGTTTENRGPALLGINIAALSLAVVATVLRCYVRLRLVRAFGLDDWLMLCAMVTFTVYCTSSIIGVTYGTGQHVWDLAQEDNSMAKKVRGITFAGITLAGET
jgi:hypothetical protein